MKNALLVATLLMPVLVMAQDWSALARDAEKKLEAGQYADAGALFERAGRLKGDKKELLYKAAECYRLSRNYPRAAQCYRSLPVSSEQYPLAGLSLARILKQNGEYEAARATLQQFYRQYRGGEQALIDAIVQNETAGIDMAVRDRGQAQPDIRINILPADVNTTGNDYAPAMFGDAVLYFSVNGGGRNALMRSVLSDGVWQAAEVAALPAEVADKFGTGVFSTDGQRFYYSRCERMAPGGICGAGLDSECALYVLEREQAGGWKTPRRLPDYINLPESSALHPFVSSDGAEEWLFFAASGRPGGFGGMDIYVCQRPLGSDDMDFSLPQNLGERVNTAGDEITPFFDPASGALFLGSNGHVSYGGFDIFSTRMLAGRWQKPENAGLPLNSAADDFFFMMKKNGRGAFLSSNRPFGSARSSSVDEDIFEISFPLR